MQTMSGRTVTGGAQYLDCRTDTRHHGKGVDPVLPHADEAQDHRREDDCQCDRIEEGDQRSERVFPPANDDYVAEAARAVPDAQASSASRAPTRFACASQLSARSYSSNARIAISS